MTPLKAKIIGIIIRVVMCFVALGVGIWYLSSSLGGDSISYSSMTNFMTAIGASDGDIAGANACFLCDYIKQLFDVIGTATEMFWGAILKYVWLLMAIGFGIFLLLHTAKHIWETAKKSAKYDTSEQKLEFKGWFDKVWRTGARILIVGALSGMLGMGGTDALKTVSTVTITPVLYLGTELAQMATGTIGITQCNTFEKVNSENDVMAPIVGSFMCVIGNINTVMLAGAAGGFSLMNYAWMGLGGGMFTWIAGLALVLMFLVIGFDLVFQILSVIFKLVFIIIFLPLFLAAAAFEKTWKLASGLVGKAIGMIVTSALRIISITLKVIILYATIWVAADAVLPGPTDNYTAILPPLIQADSQNVNSQNMSVMRVFQTCENESIDSTGVVDGDVFKTCFIREKAVVENVYPGAFDFMENGWEFFMLMLGLFLLYYYVIAPRIDKLIPQGQIKLPIPGESEDGKVSDVSTGEQFDYGAWVHDLGQKMYHAPEKWIKSALKKASESGK